MHGNTLSTCHRASCQGVQVLGTWANGTPSFSSLARLQTLTQPGRSRLLRAVTSDCIIFINKNLTNYSPCYTIFKKTTPIQFDQISCSDTYK